MYDHSSNTKILLHGISIAEDLRFKSRFGNTILLHAEGQSRLISGIQSKCEKQILSFGRWTIVIYSVDTE